MPLIDTAQSYENQYLNVLQHLSANSDVVEPDRTGTGTTRLFGAQLAQDLRKGFPLLTTKKVFSRGIFEELLWFLRGETNIKSLVSKNVNIWNEWATDDGELGPVYGAMWRNWPCADGTIDQIESVIAELRSNPESRCLIVSAWNPGLLPDPTIAPHGNAARGKQALPPCHTLFQFFAQRMSQAERWRWALDAAIVSRDLYESVPGEEVLDELQVPTYFLDCQLYQRSGDWFLGVPFNCASYSLLLAIIAKRVGMVARNFIHTFGDLHLYSNHRDQALLQLSREVRKAPDIILSERVATADWQDLTTDDIIVTDYNPHPGIKAPVST